MTGRNLLLIGALFGSGPDRIVVRKSDGSRLDAAGVALDPRAGASISGAASGAPSQVIVVPLAELVAIELPARVAPPPAPPPLAVLLHDGSRLTGSVRGGDEERLELELTGGGQSAIPVDAIRAVFVGPRSARLDVARFEEFGSGDSLHRRPEVGGDFTRGTLAAFNAEGVKFEYSLGTETFPWSDLEAVLLAKQVDLDPPKAPVIHADLRPDGTLRGTLVRMNEQELVLQPAGFEDAVVLARDEVEVVRFEGSSHAWISDLKPARVAQLPYLGPEEQFLFPWRADRSVTGAPLRVHGRRYAKGLGCHSRTTLEYALDGQWRLFEAEVGVSDEVADISDRGAVEFRVVVDGVEKWKSRVMRGGEPALATGRIDVAGAKTLVLVTDFGEGEDVADRGVWGWPLLIR